MVSPGIVDRHASAVPKGVYYTKDDIVLLNEWITSNVALLKDAGGLISNQGGSRATPQSSVASTAFRVWSQ